MNLREKKKQLEVSRQLEIDAIYEKYRPLFKELKFSFSLNEIINDGWIKSYKYFIRGAKNEYEYKKDNVTITIDCDENNDVIQIFTHSGCQDRTIIDMEDLSYYYRNQN